MKTESSILLYGRAFRPLGHWERVLPGVPQQMVDGQHVSMPKASVAWISSDVPGWQECVRMFSEAGIRVAVLARLPEAAEMNRSLACGARAYLPALSNDKVFRQVAKTILAGGLWFPENLLSSLLQSVARAVESDQGHEPKGDLQSLTSRETEVALSASKGLSNRQIASDLGITERTVKEHMGAIFKKLAVKDRMQLMLYVNGQLANRKQDNVHQA
ncbi:MULTISPECIES: helix-turn-helix transcriptional regulator [Marinobacter]|jgi:DNA-binding NarL/FixJ family response regulator|uniref:helix-turn-helix transcriptional regulator n=1 Tax=Marinobacter TaxID=2742 RepID=UPI000256EEC1|nr:response regulator transcription factor [Marinobacter nauticus]MBY6192168.1 response regulator transcription factor [Marinobacter nauticus]MBY6213316.1 response regulator transcription factor [Marinobacter nauticus]RKR78338.1 regulatory LuxR family protein [Marinobacter nauticus]CCG96813.1 putative LuxR-family transcriptional regulator [Marinobacter nauticus ATCC 49840]